MGIISSNKKINVDTMKCDGTARVSLAITAAPDILENPADIVLVLDRSGSMSGTPLASMKEGGWTDRLWQPHRYCQLFGYRYGQCTADHIGR